MRTIKPDFNQLRKVLLREGEPDYVPFYELFADVEVMEAVLEKKITFSTSVEFQYKMGYDYVGAGIKFNYPKKLLAANDTAYLSRGKRNFIDDNHGIIENRTDFNFYKWPVIDSSVSYNIQQTIKCLPDGMKIIISLPGGILENVMWLMGYVPFSYALYDDEQLVWDLFEKIRNDFTNILKRCLSDVENNKIGAIVIGDDMGFSHSTMIAPEMLRKFVFPIHKELVNIAHTFELPMILHSCGNLEPVMDDLIDYVKFDAKHSFEDKITPVTEFKEKYGSRIAVLGGVDINYISSKTESEVREYVGKILECCAPGGGYALGTGNSVTNYIPLENYLAMINEGMNKGIYNSH